MTAQWWIGGYGPDMEGIGTGIGLATTRADGTLGFDGVVAEIASPSWLIEHDGVASSGGTWPCHLAVAGSSVIVSNYFDGPVGVVSLTADGGVGELTQVLQGEGSGPRPSQPGPHAHAGFQLDESTVLTLDLGADRLHVHRLDDGLLERTASVAVAAGTGPRDIARHASGLIHVLGELSGDVLVFDWVDGVLAAVASHRVPGWVELDHGAALAYGADGRYLYTGLRGSHRIAVLRVSDDGRDLEPVGWVPSEGEWPRHLVVDGDLLHVANQGSNTIASFRLGADGMPTLIGEPTAVPSPSYLLPVS